MAVMGTTGERAALHVLSRGRGRQGRRLAAWADLMLAPVAWALDVQASSLLAHVGVPRGSLAAWGVHLLFLAFAVVGAVDCRRRWLRHQRLAEEGSGDPTAHEDAASLAAWGIGLGICFGLLILVGGLPGR